MTVMAPADENECRQMLYTAFTLDTPTAVRYPRGAGPGVAIESEMTALPVGQGEIRRACARRAAPHRDPRVRRMLKHALAAAEELDATVANMRFVKPLDVEPRRAPRARARCARHDRGKRRHGRRRQRGRGGARRRRHRGSAAASRVAGRVHRPRRPGHSSCDLRPRRRPGIAASVQRPVRLSAPPRRSGSPRRSKERIHYNRRHESPRAPADAVPDSRRAVRERRARTRDRPGRHSRAALPAHVRRRRRRRAADDRVLQRLRRAARRSQGHAHVAAGRAAGIDERAGRAAAHRPRAAKPPRRAASCCSRRRAAASSFAFPYFMRKTAPVSGVASLLDYEVRIDGRARWRRIPPNADGRRAGDVALPVLEGDLGVRRPQPALAR